MAEERVMQNDIPAHPDAALFPMLPDDELRELADDIKRNGQQLPILVKDGLIIDGRNRYAACVIAGVDPVMEEFTGTDDGIKAFIVSANINRRHMTKAARAMAVAMVYPEGERGKRNDLLNYSTSADFDKGYLSQARTVLRESESLAQQVLTGTVSLNDAYKEARIVAAARESADARLSRLAERHPDLATAVQEEQLTLNGAEAEARERDDLDRKRIAGLNESLSVLSGALRRINTGPAVVNLSRFIRDELDDVPDSMGSSDAEDLVDEIIYWANALKEHINAKDA